jgi:hypothetical protein
MNDFKLNRHFFLMLVAFSLALGSAAAGELSISGTRFQMDGKPFGYAGLSFFNAVYNTNFNASTEQRVAWLTKFKFYGVNVLRVWCQWDNRRGFVDASPDSTMYRPDGSLRAEPLRRLTDILRDADSLGIAVELVFFAQESFHENIRLSEPSDERAVTALTRELMPFRNVTFQLWNEHTDARVLPLLRIIKGLDPKRLVTNSPGPSNVLGSDPENAALDFLTPHTARQGKSPHWNVAPRQLAGLLQKYQKPVVDDEPARNGTSRFGGPEGATSPFDHIVQILRVLDAGAYPTYHHNMFQTGYGSPAVPSSGIPDPEFSPYHRQVFEFLKQLERYERK